MTRIHLNQLIVGVVRTKDINATILKLLVDLLEKY